MLYSRPSDAVARTVACARGGGSTPWRAFDVDMSAIEISTPGFFPCETDRVHLTDQNDDVVVRSMSVSAKLLEILRCPVNQRALHPLGQTRLAQLNEAIVAGDVLYVDGQPVSTPLEDALITEDDKVIYAITDQLPALLPDLGIGTTQFENW